MGLRELKEQLGIKPSANARQVYNALIRREMVGGEDLLDALELTLRLADRLGQKQFPGADHARRAHQELKAARDVMIAELRRKYEI